VSKNWREAQTKGGPRMCEKNKKSEVTTVEGKIFKTVKLASGLNWGVGA
jgi:hypothetical protein